MNEAAQSGAQGAGLNLFRYGEHAGKGWVRNIALFNRILKKYDYDIIVADEAYEISFFYSKNSEKALPPYVEIVDFVGFEPMSWRPSERFKF